MSKHPELEGVVRAFGVSYACAYMRLENGWDLARAVNTPVHVRKVKLRPLKQTREHRDIVRLQRRMNRVRQSVADVLGGAHKRHPRAATDTSPQHIRKLRAAFCDEFIKTGVINTELQNQLRVYADDCRSNHKNSQRVSAEPEDHRHRGRQARVVDERVGDGDQAGETARRVLHYLRS